MNQIKRNTRSLVFVLVPVCAVLIFLSQLHRQRAYDLTIWKGGGMGMFAGIDGPSMRLLHIKAVDAGGNEHPILRLSPRQKKLRDALLTEPTPEKFRNLACALLKSDWWSTTETRRQIHAENVHIYEFGEPFILIAPNKTPNSEEIDIGSISLSFYKTEYDKSKSKIFTRLIESYETKKC